MWKEFDEIINKYKPIKYIKQKSNLGKAYNINLLTKDIPINKYDLLLTFDSDIIFIDSVKYIEKINILLKIINYRKLGLISFNFLENNVHIFEKLNKNLKIKSHHFFWNKNRNSIGGGCWLVNFKYWKLIKGYKIMGVYCGEDGYLLNCMNKRNLFCAVDISINVIHPKEKNSKYQKMEKFYIKKNMVKQLI